jgi:hypothetical protein
VWLHIQPKSAYADISVLQAARMHISSAVSCGLALIPLNMPQLAPTQHSQYV